MFIVRGRRCGAGDFFDRSSGHNRNTTAASSNRRGSSYAGNAYYPATRRFFLLPSCGRLGEIQKVQSQCSCDCSQVHRLCGYASGTMMINYAVLSCSTIICKFFTSIKHSRLHFGQNSGKFFNSVSLLTLVLVLLSHMGHSTQVSFSAIISIPQTPKWGLLYIQKSWHHTYHLALVLADRHYRGTNTKSTYNLLQCWPSVYLCEFGNIVSDFLLEWSKNPDSTFCFPYTELGRRADRQSRNDDCCAYIDR